MMRASLRACLVLAIVLVVTILVRPVHSQTGGQARGKAGPGYAIAATPVKRVRGELSYRVNGPRIQAREWMVFVARMPELPSQSDVRTKVVPDGVPARDYSEAARPLLAARIAGDSPNAQGGFEVHIEYEATLVARKLVKLKPGASRPDVVPLDAKTRRIELASGRYMDFDSKAFQKWLEDRGLRRASSEGDVDFARRAFLQIKREFQYEFTEHMDRHASHLCTVGRGDCGGMSIMFASALRAHGIPARLLTGRWATSSTPRRADGLLSDQVHVKAEFFAEGVGWVPVDLSSAVLHDRSPEGLRYFGNDPGDFVTFHVDSDLSVETYFGRKVIEWLQIPSFWVIGSGSLDGLTSRCDWKVQSEPIEFREAALRKPAGSAASSSSRAKTPNPSRRRSQR